jgi:hypothetical protein
MWSGYTRCVVPAITLLTLVATCATGDRSIAAPAGPRYEASRNGAHGDVYRVTSLADGGPETLRYGIVPRRGPRRADRDRRGLPAGSPPSTPALTQPTTRYVDPTLAAACSTYHPPTRTCDRGTASAYPTLAEAAAVVNPGDTVFARGGVYAYRPNQGLTLSRSGLPGRPITWSGYQSEPVWIKGRHDTDVNSSASCTAGDGIRDWDEDCDGDGKADGPGTSAKFSNARFLMVISGDYITVRKMRMSHGRAGILNQGKHNLIEEMVIHDTWFGLVSHGNGAEFNTLRYTALFRSHHWINSGVAVSGTGRANQNIFYRNLVAHAGQQQPNNARVLPALGDPNGGGDSNAMGASGNCLYNAPGGGLTDNMCLDNVWQENIMWDNNEDGIETYSGNDWVIANMAVDPVGQLRSNGFNIHHYPAFGYTWSGNVTADESDGVGGFTIRGHASIRVLHNLALRLAPRRGFLAAQGKHGAGICRNNISRLNGIEFALGWCAASNNFNGDTSGAPGLVDENFGFAAMNAITEACIERGAPHLVTVQSCWQAAWNTIHEKLSPAPGTPIIDAGSFLAGYHCPSADDDPVTPEPASSACRHWRGSAPDQGPFEFGYRGNNGSNQPDMTKCAVTGGC